MPTCVKCGHKWHINSGGAIHPPAKAFICRDCKFSLSYKGYTGSVQVEYDAPRERNEYFFGTIQGIKDVVTYESDYIDGIEKAFQESVDDYIAFCEERGEKPNEPGVVSP